MLIASLGRSRLAEGDMNVKSGTKSLKIGGY